VQAAPDRTWLLLFVCDQVWRQTGNNCSTMCRSHVSKCVGVQSRLVQIVGINPDRERWNRKASRYRTDRAA
jgi:hypothetical protein